MDSHPFPFVLALAALVSPLAPSTAAAQTPPGQADDRIVIYRCTDARGHLSLRDSPCRAGERQDIRTMARPRDARPAPATAAAATAPGAAPAPQVLLVHAPRPLYECVAPNNVAENRRYLSDSPEGKLRWVPRPGGAGLTDLPLYDPNHGFVQVSDNGQVVGTGNTLVIDNGAWVRDACHALPPADACARLREERGDLGRRRFNAQATERAEINREERSVDARIANDCG